MSGCMRATSISQCGWKGRLCASTSVMLPQGVELDETACSVNESGTVDQPAFAPSRFCHWHLITKGTSCSVILFSSGCSSKSGSSGARCNTYTCESSSEVDTRTYGCVHSMLMRSSRSDEFFSNTSSESMRSNGSCTGSESLAPFGKDRMPSCTRTGERSYATNRFAGPSRSRSLPVPSPAPRS